jgi:hypothetical protein
MTTNKILFLLILGIIGVNFYFNKLPPPLESNDTENEEMNFKTSHRQKNDAIKKFAHSLEQNPELLAHDSSPSNNLTVHQAIDNFLNNENNLEYFSGHNSYLELIRNKKQEALPLILARYLNMDSTEEESEKQKLLNLAIELCNNETDTSCSDFLYAEALNKTISADQQMNALKGYINTMGVGKDEKLELLSTFRANNPFPQLKEELDNIEEYVENNNNFIQSNLESNDQEPGPASDGQQREFEQREQ